RVDLAPCAASGYVQRRIGSPPAQAGQAESAAGGYKPALLGSRNKGGAARNMRHENRLESLAGLIGCGPVALDAEDPSAPLPVAAELAAADESREIEAVRDRRSGRDRHWRRADGASRSREMLAPSGRRTGARTDIATAPGVGRRRGRWRWRCISRHRPFGSECRWRSQAQRDQCHASEKQL